MSASLPRRNWIADQEMMKKSTSAGVYEIMYETYHHIADYNAA